MKLSTNVQDLILALGFTDNIRFQKLLIKRIARIIAYNPSFFFYVLKEESIFNNRLEY